MRSAMSSNLFCENHDKFTRESIVVFGNTVFLLNLLDLRASKNKPAHVTNPAWCSIWHTCQKVHKVGFSLTTFEKGEKRRASAVADPGGAAGARPPTGLDSFVLTYNPPWGWRPPMGNPGSTTVLCKFFDTFMYFLSWVKSIYILQTVELN